MTPLIVTYYSISAGVKILEMAYTTISMKGTNHPITKNHFKIFFSDTNATTSIVWRYKPSQNIQK